MAGGRSFLYAAAGQATAQDRAVANHYATRPRSARIPWRALSGALALWLALGLAISSPGPVRRRARPAARERTAAARSGLSSLPLGAQAPISAVLGAVDPAYRFFRSAPGLRAVNPAQQLSERFGASRVLIGHGKVSMAMSLRGVGYGLSPRSLGATARHVQRNYLTYSYPGLSEWYRNGPLGLEQGFTLDHAPAGLGAGPLTLSLALSARGGVSLGQRGLLISRARSSLRYGEPHASDARGRALPSWLELRSGMLLVRVDARHARYPLTIDPLIQQGEKLVGGEQAGTPTPRLGISVALSSDGSTALIGGPGDYGGTGAAWVFTRSGTTWTQQGAKLTGGQSSGAATFGQSVALSSDGNTALIGGPGDSKEAGAAWVFTRSEGTWKQQEAKLVGGEEVSTTLSPGEFGASVALSSDGNTALIGGPGDGTSAGAAWVFTRAGATWSQQGPKLTGKEEVGEGEFGFAVALSPDGNTALIGGPADSKGAGETATGIGAAWAFTRSGTTWTQQAKLKGTSELGEARFGQSVALATSEGNTALIGGPDDGPVLEKEGEVTEQSAIVKLSSTSGILAGSEVTGTNIPAGTLVAEVKSTTELKLTAPAEGTGTKTAKEKLKFTERGLGAAWAFTRTSGKWTQQAKLTATSEVGLAQFGESVALAVGEGNTALIGGPTDNKGVAENATGIGATWVFTRSGTTWTQRAKLIGGSESGEAGVGQAVALSSEGNTALIGGPLDAGNVGAGWVFTGSGATWSQQAKLLGTGASAKSQAGMGASVALSADGNTALIGGPGDGLGSAWVFTRSGSTWTQQGPKLTGGEEAGERVRFGASVALSADGSTAVIGGPLDGSETGAAWVFTRSGATWSQQGPKLAGTEEVGKGTFGVSVALSSDGTTALVGGDEDKEGAGAAWVFTRSGSTWTQQGPKLTGAGATGALAPKFGMSVALASEGSTALIGGPFDNLGHGSAWVFTRSGTTWTQQAKLTGTEEVGLLSELGTSGALSSDGNTALVGGPDDNFEAGAAWVFTRSGATWTQQGPKITPTGESGAGSFGEAVALSSIGNKALVGGPLDSSSAGAVWAFARSGSTWAQLGSKLTPTGEIGAGAFGSSVALSSSAGTALIGGSGDFGATGAAWPFLQAPPIVKTEAASSITATSATLNASVNANGSEVSGCTLEYGTTEAYGQSAPCTPSPGSGESAVAVSAPITGLTAGTTYHFRVSATNGGGTSKGSDQTFKTAIVPTAVTLPATAPTKTSATLNATVNPNGFEVSECKLEYGSTPSYGSSAPCAPTPGSGTNPVAVSAAIGGLTERSTYHFRVSATNANGTSKGADQTLRTLPAPHYYLNAITEAGALPAGVKVPVLSWGALTVTPEAPSKATPTSCETGSGGSVENPEGLAGGAGRGQTQGYGAWNCESASCPAGLAEFPSGSGKFVEKEALVLPGGEAGSANEVGGSLPWASELFEPKPPKVRSESKGVVLILACVARKSVEGGPPLGDGDGDSPQLLLPASVCSTNPLNLQAPLFERGTQIGGPLTSKLNFDAESGKLSCLGPGEKEGEQIAFTAAMSGRLKTMTFEGQELLLAK